MNDLLPASLMGRLRWLAAELAPFPGRGNFAMRLTLASALAIIIGEIFQIPSMVMSLVAVVFTTQSNIVLTRVVFVALAIANTIAIALFVVVLNLFYDMPLLRILCSGVLFFCFMYCQRISKLGALLLGPALVLLYAQSFTDQTDQAEYLVRQLLWAALAITYGSALGVLVNTFFPGAHPQQQLRDEVHRQLSRAAQRLLQLGTGHLQTPALAASVLQRQAAVLQNLAAICAVGNARDYAGNLYRQSCVATVSHIQHVSEGVSAEIADMPPTLRQALQSLSEQLLALDTAIADQQPFKISWTPTADELAALQAFPPAEDIFRTLLALDHFDSTQMPEQPPAKEPLLVPDAFSNPAYTHFALKVLICGMAGYFVFTVLQWPGIHTILITSGMVALPGLGTSVRQMSLRFYGALAGSLAALFIVIFVMPYLDTIVGLLLAVLPVIALGAWITVGSERLAYFGTQGAATFAIPIFDRFGPTTDLTEVRDRMVGILLGVGICWVVHVFLWPESEDSQARDKLSALLRALADMVRLPVNRDAGPSQMTYMTRHLQCWSQLNGCAKLLEQIQNDPQFKNGVPAQRVHQAETLLAMSRDILILQDRIRSRLPQQSDLAALIPPETVDGIRALREEATALLDLYADRIVQSGRPPTAEQAQLRAHAQQILAENATDQPLLKDMQHLALKIADLPDWSFCFDDTNAAAGSPTDPAALEKAP